MIGRGLLPLARRRPIVGRLPRIELRQHPHLRTSQGVRPLVTASFLFAKMEADHGQARLGESDHDHELDRQIVFKIPNLLGCWGQWKAQCATITAAKKQVRGRPFAAATGRGQVPWGNRCLPVSKRSGVAEKGAELHAWLVSGHDYAARLRSVQRYVLRSYPPPRRAQRRVDTLPRVQAQADWAWFQRMRPGCTRRGLLAWLSVHDAALQRPGGVPATVRINNENTAMVAGSRAWGPVSSRETAPVIGEAMPRGLHSSPRNTRPHPKGFDFTRRTVRGCR